MPPLLLEGYPSEDTKSMKHLSFFFSSIAVLLLAAGCAKQTLATKPYHNLTGRYNAYYNANMILAENFEVLNTQHRDNYNQLLPLYPYSAVADATAVKQPLDEAIIKSARNVKLHTIGNWTDDSYQLLGKAEFLQQEYERAANTFKYVVDKYRPEETEQDQKTAKSNSKGKTVKKKRKKKRRRKRVRVRRRRVKRRKPARRKKKKVATKKPTKKPQKTATGDPEEEEEVKPIKYGLKHRPVRHKSMLWLAKTYIELEMYDEAGYYLRQLANDGTVPYKLRPEVQAVTADLWIRQKDYEQAITHLQIAVNDTKQRDRKTRYAYILAQLYQMQDNNQLAMEYFQKVLRLKPSYEMEFNARLNMAKNAAQIKGKQPIDPIIALRRLLRDRKNEEYRDQIHFAIAEIQLKKGQREAGIASLQRSLAAGNNPAQRTEGALLLAELYYEEDAFVASYAYYDTTLMAMNEKDERHVQVSDKKRRLEGVATHLAAKIEYDSMLVVGAWDRPRQERWAINGLEQEARSGQQVAGGAGVDFRRQGGNNFVEEPGRSPRPTRAAVSGGVRLMDAEMQKSKFPLYNPTLRKKGEREFSRRWDNRSWVDDWRRSNKEEEQNIDLEEDLAYAPKTQAEINGYLKKKGVPLSDQERASKKEQLATELFLAAQHYREDLGRNDKALELVNELLTDHPTSPYAVEALFLAYNSYREQNNNSRADYYKTQIINNYPKSDIAKVLQDPDFANAERRRYEQINAYYDEAYQLLKKGEAEQALNRVREVPKKFGNDYDMKARFAVLEAMCIGGVKGEKDYIRALGVVATSYPNTKEEEQARAMIALLKRDQKSKKNGANANAATNPTAKIPFTYNPNAKHMVLVVFEDPKIKTNALRVQVTNYNNQFYIDRRFSVSAILIDPTRSSISVRSFANAKEAVAYAEMAEGNPEFLNGVEGYRVYAVSNENYAYIATKRQFGAYDAFYQEHYK